MHYTLNSGTEERIWAVIKQHLLLSVKNKETGRKERSEERRRNRRQGDEKSGEGRR